MFTEVFLIVLVLLGIVVLPVCAHGLTDEPVTINDKFPISAWWPPPPGETTLERYKDMVDAGFTFFLAGNGVTDKPLNEKVLEYTEQLGLGAILIDRRIRRPPVFDEVPQWLVMYMDAVVAEYKDYPGLAGFILVDEPNASEFFILGEVNKYLLDKMPRWIPYINLFPNYASKEQLGTETYEEYVDSYLRIVQPRILSFDFYPFIRTGWLNRDAIKDGFFSNLEVISRKSVEYNIPFWTFIQTCHSNGRRDPLPEEIRWQVYQNLAYGAKGIQYFLYWSLPSDNPETLQGGIVDTHGNKTRHYDTVKDINAELMKIGPILLTLTSQGVYHTGRLPSDLSVNNEPAWLNRASGDDVVIGTFISIDGSTYIMVVNRSFSKNAFVELSIESEFSKVLEVSKDTGESKEAALENRSGSKVLRISLEKGDGLLFKLD